MKITLFLIVGLMFSVQAETFSQATKIDLDLSNTKLVNILNEIEENSEYNFFYNINLDEFRDISIHAKNKTVKDILDSLMEETGLSYEVIDRYIVIKNTDNGKINNSGIQQSKSISGTVKDEAGVLLPGVTVLVKGTTNGTVTNANGEYSLPNVSAGNTIVFSFVGMVSQEVLVGNQAVINITLLPDAIGIEEVVAIGYGTRKKATLTGAISTADSKLFETRPVTNAVAAIQGALPGLVVSRSSSQPGNEGLNIQLRGLSSLNGGNSPLVLVDGLQTTLSTINPDDIESLSVLKDGTAAIYGNQAANGVILITTKKGKKGTPTVEYSFTYGGNKATYIPEKLTMRHYMEVVNEGFVNDGAAPLYGQIFFDALGTDQVLNFNQTRLGGAAREDSYLIFNQPENLYVDEFYETGIRQNHNFSVSGGGNNSTYRLSLGYLDEDGVVNAKFDGFKRYNVRLNNTFELSDKLRLTFQNSLEIGDRSSSTELNTAISRLRMNWTFGPVRRTDGEYYTFRGFVNPLDLLAQGGEAELTTTRLISNAGLEYDIFEGLKFNANIGINRNTIKGRNEVPTIYLINEWTIDDTPGTRIQGYSNPNRLIETNETENYASINAYLTYNKIINEVHQVSLTAGGSHEQRRDNLMRAESRDFPTNDLFSLRLGNLEEARVSSNGFAWTIRSLFGRLNYTYKDKYIVDANFRYDGSSRFDPDSRWGFFSGYLAAWRLSEEGFIKDLGIFDNLKLRASYGETGNQQGIGIYDYLSLINVNSPIILGTPTGGMFGDQNENQYFVEAGAVSLERSWETIATTNFGVDLSVLNSKLNMSFDYFVKKNKDMLVGVDVPTVLGIAPPALNKGEMETKGFELELSWNDKIGDFNYFIRGTLFNDKNKLVKLEGSEGVKREGINNRLLGYSTGTYFGWAYDGLIQNQQELDDYKAKVTSGLPGGITIGDVRYKDLDGNGQLSALGNPANGDTGDLVELGNIRPQYSFSLNFGGSYKGFDLNVLLQGVGKRTLFKTQQFRAPIEGGQWYFQGLEAFYGNTWTSDNVNAKYPRLSVNGGVNNYNYRNSSNTKFNGAYVRLKNLQIGYSLPQSVLSKIKIEKIRLFVSGEDLWELQSKESRDFGYDPESGTASVGYPFVRTFSVGAQVTF